MTIPTRPWTEIATSLADASKGSGEWLEPLARFAGKVAGSPYANALHGYLSMHCLCIGQTDEIRDGQERFMIVFEPARAKFRFALSDARGWLQVNDPPPLLKGKPGWYRETSTEEAFPLFLKFLGQLGWVPELKRRASADLSP